MLVYAVMFGIILSVFLFRLLSAMYCAFIKGEIYGSSHSLLILSVERGPFIEKPSFREAVNLLLTGKNIPGIFLEFLLSFMVVTFTFFAFATFYIILPFYIFTTIMILVLLPVIGLVYRAHTVKRQQFVETLRGQKAVPMFKRIG